ncbi:MAG TPA: hypothetical protein VHG51_12080 [Longimicrobiaceae bacterium]|nr:hypothetical protein [Longimicrobiaceae bacterium]
MKPFLVYLGLVGAPLLGLLAILRAGERIVPPHHVGGRWEVAADLAAGIARICPGLEFPPEGAAVEVSQSGARARLVLNDGARTELDAGLRGAALAGVAGERGPVPCGGRGLRLAARLDTLGGAELLGTVSVPGCGGCPPAPFRAVRVPSASAR